jgi:glycine betaine/proline transport system substrate-binding protein
LNKQVKVLLFVLLALSLTLAACQPAAAPAAEEPAEEMAAEEPAEEMEAEEPAEEMAAEEPAAEEPAEEMEAEEPAEEMAEKELVRFGDQQWQSLWINNAIAMFVIEHGYGYPVEVIEMTTPVFQQSIVEGDIQVNMESWFMNYPDWWTEVVDDGSVVDAGEIFESSAQGWYVPRYVIEGDAERGIEPIAPDLKSVFDLPEYASLFPDPEDPDKGVLVSCITGWQCAEVNRIKFYAYGLPDTYNILEPGSQGALDAAIAGAYKKGDPVLAYYWEPTWLLGTYDMVRLEEPEYTDECWAAMESIRVEGEELDVTVVTPEMGCAYENLGIPAAINGEFAERAPEVAEFVTNMFLGTDRLNEIAAYMTNNEVSADEAVIWFFKEYPDQWHEWVPEDVAAKVEAALP